MPQKTVYGKATKENVNVAAVKPRTDNYIPSNVAIPNYIKESLAEVKSKFDKFYENSEDINLRDAYDELKGIIKNLHGYDQVLKLKVEYGEDSDIKTGEDLLEALYNKVRDSYVSQSDDETIPDLFNTLYRTIMGPK